jgi:TPR repeat protein
MTGAPSLVLSMPCRAGLWRHDPFSPKYTILALETFLPSAQKAVRHIRPLTNMIHNNTRTHHASNVRKSGVCMFLVYAEKLYADSDDVFGKMSIVKLEPLTKTNVENDVVALYMPHLRAMACAGDIRAIVELGACYKYGKSLPQSDTECNKWWNIAANQGRCDIQRSMGVRIEAGTGLEKKDYDTAFLWYMKSAVQGHFEGFLLIHIAIICKSDSLSLSLF